MAFKLLPISSTRAALITSVASLAIVGFVISDTWLGRTTIANAQTQSLSLSSDVVRIQQPSFADMVDRVQPAVVSIRVQKVSPIANAGTPDRQFDDMFRDLPQGHPFQRFYEEFRGSNRDFQSRRAPARRGQGSGFIVSEEGYVVTNNHVIEGASEVEIKLSDGREYSGEVIGTDEKTDLALVRIDANGEKFSFVEFADDTSARVGDWVVAVGNPYGLGGTVTAGIISARGRDIGASVYDDFLQIDAPINRGNSGGPTFNMLGQVVGVNTAIYSPSGGSVGIGFAIPATTAERIVEDLRDDGSVLRGWLGVQIQSLDMTIANSLGLADTNGALVTLPQADGPAATAGIRAGDTILSVEGDAVGNPRELARIIADLPPEKTVSVKIWRNGEEVTLQVVLGELPRDDVARAAFDRQIEKPATFDLSQLGLSLGRPDGRSGVVINEVAQGGLAAESGLRTGQRLMEVDGVQVSSPATVATAIEQAKIDGKPAILMLVRSDRGVRYVAVPLDRG